MQQVQIVRADRVITPDRELADAWVAVRGEQIVGVGEGPVPTGELGVGDDAAARDLDGASKASGPVHPLLVPGFVDIHNHGGGGGAFTDGVGAARVARAVHLREGTTTLVASLVTDSVEVLLEQVRSLVPLVRDGGLAGIHLEGPWLSEQWCGAHPPALLADPSLASVASLVDAADGSLVMVTLAPERQGALEAITLLRERGVVVALGHTDATYDQTCAAIEAGASVATHLYNGERPAHHREPGPTVALLESPRVAIESIVDGAHLHPAVVRATARAAGERWVLVTDAMAAALMGDGHYQLGTQGVDVVDGLARLADGGSLAGSTLSLSRALRTAVEMGVPLVSAVRAATLAPAEALGWSQVGRIEPGCRADLVALGEDLAVREVMTRGAWIDRRAPLV